jgi:superfamily II RNA helicase
MVVRASITQVRFRLRKQLIDRLQRAAKAADRSLNDEVEQRLEYSFRKEDLREAVEVVAENAVARAIDGLRDSLVKQLAKEQVRLAGELHEMRITPTPPGFEQDPAGQDAEPKPKRKPTKES